MARLEGWSALALCSAMTDSGVEAATNLLRAYVHDQAIRPDPNYFYWHSGVYIVIDCVFSAQAKYENMVLPILRERLPQRAGLLDEPDLTFSRFIESVDRIASTDERFERYAGEVLGNRQKIGRRLKAQIAYEVCRFFVQRDLQTMADLKAVPDDALDTMILDDLVGGVYGIGPVLARYLMLLIGREDHVKPDTMLVRLFGRLGDWKPRLGHHDDMERIRTAITQVANEIGTTPARLDNALWFAESTRARGS